MAREFTYDQLMQARKALGLTAPFQGSDPNLPPEEQIYTADIPNSDEADYQQLQKAQLVEPPVSSMPPEDRQQMEQQSIFRNLMPAPKPNRQQELETMVGRGAPIAADAGVLAGKVEQSAPQGGGRSLAAVVGAAPEEKKAPSIMDFLDFGKNNLANKENLQKAIEDRNTKQLLANIGAAANTFSGGLAKTGPVDNSFYDKLGKQAEQSVTDYEKQVEFQKQDPNSGYSKGLKDYFKNKLGIEIRGDASAAELEKLMPFAVREYEAKLERERMKQQRADENSLKRELAEKDRDLRREIAGMKSEKDAGKADTKADDKANADFMKMAEKLSGAKASSRSAFGKAALNKAAAERLETLVAGRDLNDLDVREIQEVARALDSLLAQGQPTITGTHELVPKTWRGGAAKVGEYILNERKGAGAGSFLKQMIKTVGREKELAQKQMDQYKKELVPGYEHLEKKDPERFNRVLYGSAESTPAASPSESNDPKIQKYADEHFSGDYQKAKVLLEKRGYGG